MTTCQLVKQAGGALYPAYESDRERITKIKIGTVVHADIKQPRNPLFHRKFFAMLNFAFEYFEPEIQLDNKTTLILKNYSVEKDFERFRKDVLIMAGFRYPVVNIKGEVRWEAESISFAKMDETRFHEVYRAVFSVLWRLVLSKVDGMTEQNAQTAIDQLLSYD